MIRLLKIPFFRPALLSLAVILFLPAAKAQVIKWPNPEAEQLYKNAQASLSAGAFKQAIASYQQALTVVPGQMVLHRDLAQAYLLSGDPQRAEKAIQPIIEKDEADASSYGIAANIQLTLHAEKRARKLLDKGMEKFPHSGYLYHERGKLYEAQGDIMEALKQWVAGTVAEPGYHLNYYEVARGYMQTTKHVWAIIYGEIFVNLERPTPRSGETRKLLLAAYRRFYATQDVAAAARLGKAAPATGAASFEDAVTQTLQKLAPVVSGGVNAESLTMLRTRFSLEWMSTYAAQYPFTLFRMHDDLLRAGHFDAYNQWLFGRADNPAQYDSWIKFHPEAIPEYEAFYTRHPLQPTVSDAYNNDINKRMFLKEHNQYKR